MDERNSIEGTLRRALAPQPLTAAVFQILLALSDGERHGYGIMQEIASRPNARMRMGPGTLYGTIKRLLDDGMIEESDLRPDPALDDQRRRYYRLTPYGQAAARAEAERLAELVLAARRKRLLPARELEPAGGGI